MQITIINMKKIDKWKKKLYLFLKNQFFFWRLSNKSSLISTIYDSNLLI